MRLFDTIHATGHEQVLLSHDPSSHYRSIIAIHSTRLGPAVGGTRLWRYKSDGDALTDALRLSRAMTYKNAAAGLDLGGGKAVLLAPPSPIDRQALFRAHGRFIQKLGGLFITAEDVGTSPDDMAIVRHETPHVAGLQQGGGDPSPWTAKGVYRAMQAAARYRLGTDNLGQCTIAIQGAGHVGYHLAHRLHKDRARLYVADIDAARAGRLADHFNAEIVSPDEIHRVKADIFAPCALGGILDDRTIPELRAEIVAGAANNQLLEDRHGEALERKGVLYVPDYIANAGGVISGALDLLGWDTDTVRRKVHEIHDTVLGVREIAKAEGIPTSLAADHLAERRLAQAG